MSGRLVRLALPVLGLVLLILAWHVAVIAFHMPAAVLPKPALVLDSALSNWRLIVSEGWITLLESF
jgi:NitT/TauT family transport system permease protein